MGVPPSVNVVPPTVRRRWLALAVPCVPVREIHGARDGLLVHERNHVRTLKLTGADAPCPPRGAGCSRGRGRAVCARGKDLSSRQRTFAPDAARPANSASASDARIAVFILVALAVRRTPGSRTEGPGAAREVRRVSVWRFRNRAGSSRLSLFRAGPSMRLFGRSLAALGAETEWLGRLNVTQHSACRPCVVLHSLHRHDDHTTTTTTRASPKPLQFPLPIPLGSSNPQPITLRIARSASLGGAIDSLVVWCSSR